MLKRITHTKSGARGGTILMMECGHENFVWEWSGGSLAQCGQCDRRTGTEPTEGAPSEERVILKLTRKADGTIIFEDLSATCDSVPWDRALFLVAEWLDLARASRAQS